MEMKGAKKHPKYGLQERYFKGSSLTPKVINTKVENPGLSHHILVYTPEGNGYKVKKKNLLCNHLGKKSVICGCKY